jgi:hypothetical protein
VSVPLVGIDHLPGSLTFPHEVSGGLAFGLGDLGLRGERQPVWIVIADGLGDRIHFDHRVLLTVVAELFADPLGLGVEEHHGDLRPLARRVLDGTYGPAPQG